MNIDLTQRFDWLTKIIIVLGLVAIGAALMYHWQSRTIEESPSAAIKQADGSLVVERKPAAKPVLKHLIPKGGHVEREVSVTVKPDALPIDIDGHKACPPVRVDLSLVRMEDQTRRVVASSPDGQVVGGIDVPIETPTAVDPPKWATGLSYDPIKQTPGVWIERDILRVRLGAEINQTRLQIGGPTAIEMRLRVGFTF